jgi:uroporphyrinogen decarboxylase
MTPRQRWLAVLDGRRPDRIPCDYWGTAEITTRLRNDLGCRTERALWDRLGVDKCIYLGPAHPRARESGWHLQSLFSIWRVETRKISYGDGLGEYEEDSRHPLAEAETVAEIQAFDWPDAADFDIAGLKRTCLEWQGYPILGATSEPFYLYCRLRGMEMALEDLVARPAMAEAILERIFRFDYAIIRRVLEEAGDLVDLIYVAEDLGTQQSLLMSPKMFSRFLKPRMAKLIEMIHSYGARVFHHDDGAIRPLIAGLIEIGIDILNPIQWRCRGMDRAALAADFGKHVVFHGGVDNQQTLPFGAPEDVRRQVRENIEIFSAGRGYIVAPCHNIQANTPTENVIALYQAVREYGNRGSRIPSHVVAVKES